MRASCSGPRSAVWDGSRNLVKKSEATLLRGRLIAELGALDDPEVMAEARRRFAALVRDRTAMPPALREPIAKAVAYSADQQIYDGPSAPGARAGERTGADDLLWCARGRPQRGTD